MPKKEKGKQEILKDFTCYCALKWTIVTLFIFCLLLSIMILILLCTVLKTDSDILPLYKPIVAEQCLLIVFALVGLAGTLTENRNIMIIVVIGFSVIVILDIYVVAKGFHLFAFHLVANSILLALSIWFIITLYNKNAAGIGGGGKKEKKNKEKKNADANQSSEVGDLGKGEIEAMKAGKGKKKNEKNKKNKKNNKNDADEGGGAAADSDNKTDNKNDKNRKKPAKKGKEEKKNKKEKDKKKDKMAKKK